MKMKNLAIVVAAFLSSLQAYAAPQSNPSEKSKAPKLILMLVIDQFRADYLLRFESRFLPARGASGVKRKWGGYRTLMNGGAYYPYAQYDILQSMTCPGHATVLTGAYPYQAGIPSNEWFNTATQKYTYCAEDPASSIVGAKVDDPHLGTSPKNLLASTVGDELKNAGYPSKVVTLSLKDRAAIMMGGQRPDLAVWLEPKSFQWVSSKFYLPGGELPAWVRGLNEELKAAKGNALAWRPDGPGTGFSAKDSKALIDAKNAGKYGGTAFPHETKMGSKESLAFPFGLEITEKAAEAAIDWMKLGQGESTDLFAVSFSTHDYLGHVFGPNSREMEEMTIAEDQILAKFLNHLERKIPGGLANVTIVLTGDHGITPNPDWLADHQVKSGRIDETLLAKQINDRLQEKFGKLKDAQSFVSYCHDFNIFLNHAGITEKKLVMAEVEAEAKAVVMQTEGIAHVLTSSEYAAKKLPPGMFDRQSVHTYYPGRSGDLVVIPKPYFIPAESDTVIHVTGYAYDRTVPLIFYGYGIKPGKYANRADVIDIAPTLSYLAKVLPPNMSEGRVLSEILK